MARHGENIRKRQDGRWEGRYKSYSEKKGKVVYVSVYGRTYAEAKEKLTTKKILQKTGTADPPGQAGQNREEPTLGRLAGEWLTQVKRSRKPSTYVKYRQVYETHIRGRFGDALPSELTDQSVREAFRQMQDGERPPSDSLTRSIYSILNQILKYASRHYPITAGVLTKPAPGRRNPPARPLHTREQRKLLRTLRRDMDLYKLAALLCLYMGLRLGELCALKWSDIDLRGMTLTVSRTVQRLRMEGHKTKTVLLETAPKSESSRRELPLPAQLARLLAKFQDGREYVFGGEKPLEPRTMQNHWGKILKEAGLPGRKFHTLRHTFATNCVERGVDVKSLSDLLGHSDVQITLNRYVHPSMETKRRHMESMDAFYGQIYGRAG